MPEPTKVLCVFGTRPEAIKMAPVVKELQNMPDRFACRVCVTGQHREMLDQVLRLFDIRPDYDLNIMQTNQSLTQLTAKALTSLEPVMVTERPDWVLVQGDTTTATCAALVAFYHRIKVGHIEAGLRTWNKFHPFPEEVNRKLVDAFCDIHFAPTEVSRQNLLREGISDSSIHVTGNTVVDALNMVANLEPTAEILSLFQSLGMQDTIGGLPSAASASHRLILVTAHRRESFGKPLENICIALRQIASQYSEARIVYPVHLNPNVRRVVNDILGDIKNISLLEPLDYLPMVYLMKRSYLILTDSGGIQEEAPAFGVPVLVLRETTERTEAIEAGTARLVGTDTEKIVEWASRLLDDECEHHKMAHAANPFGDGHASERIVEQLLGRESEIPIEALV
ncbi:MAG: UDP-N-acetylglucosamine 2-epimerase (non-hydrolyzing) [Dehalococcoidia bacterium]|nr:UDP-N-acetylglucosamine 2-epimerase (non-hydrolyzing) [Dehalococcoidia bacterium]